MLIIVKGKTVDALNPQKKCAEVRTSQKALQGRSCSRWYAVYSYLQALLSRSGNSASRLLSLNHPATPFGPMGLSSPGKVCLGLQPGGWTSDRSKGSEPDPKVLHPFGPPAVLHTRVRPAWEEAPLHPIWPS